MYLDTIKSRLFLILVHIFWFNFQLKYFYWNYICTYKFAYILFETGMYKWVLLYMD